MAAGEDQRLRTSSRRGGNFGGARWARQALGTARQSIGPHTRNLQAVRNLPAKTVWKFRSLAPPSLFREPLSPLVHARSRSLARLASRATKINLATCESQVSLCSGDIEANSVWPSKSADSRSQRYMLLPVSSFSFILAFFGFQFSQRADVANILLPNWPDPTFHLNQFTAGGYADHPGAKF